MILYHVTKKGNLSNILKNGLLPLRGDNKKLVNEEKNGIFLCEKKDISIWAFLLKSTCVLEVDTKEFLLEKFEYQDYLEYFYEGIIPVEQIRFYKKHRFRRTKKIEALMDGYLFSINFLVIQALKLKEREDVENFNYLIEDIKSYLNINLQFKDFFSQKYLRQCFKEWGEDGMYTIFDSRCGTTMKAYKHLLELKNETTTKLHHYIKNQFNGCLSLNTGGWE